MNKTLTDLLGNSQMLDGGAMFGNAPKALWTRWYTPDEANRIPLACRALLIEEEGGRRILLETGIGAFFPPKLKARYGVVEDRHVLLDSLAAHGLTDADIDVVVLSHLHFDHAGGLLAPYAEGEPHRLLFPNAQFLTSKKAWERNLHPHPRDRASYIPELPGLLEATGRMHLVDGPTSELLGPDYRLHYSDGHTPGLLLVEIAMPDGPIVFAGDLIPATAWMHTAITMGYDRFPELLIDEKKAMLQDLEARGGRLFFTHDHATAMCAVTRDDRGRFGPGASWPTLQQLSE